MSSPLPLLVDVRRTAEAAARSDLERARAAHVAADAEEARLLGVLRAAKAALRKEERRPSSAPRTVAQAQTRERYRERLQAAVDQAALALGQHRAGAQEDALAAEDRARAAHETARVALAAAEQLAARADAAAAKLAERRAEAAATDRANAAYVRRRGRP